MEYATVLDEGNKAAQAVFSLFTNANTMDDIVYDHVWAMDDQLQGKGNVQCAFFIVVFDTVPFV